MRHGQRLLRGLLANEAKAGRHFTKVTPTRSSPDFAEFLLDLAEAYPEADTIHLVLDNLSTHTRKTVVDRFGEEDGTGMWDRFTVHHTPKHGSWLNQAEIEIGLFSRQCLGKRRSRISTNSPSRPTPETSESTRTKPPSNGPSQQKKPAKP